MIKKILITIIFLIILNNTYSENVTYICDETDTGIDLFLFGETILYTENYTLNTKRDSCKNSNTLIEFYCDYPNSNKPQIKNTSENCDYGCANGACLKESPTIFNNQTCQRYKIHEEIAGVTDINGNEFPNQCLDSTQLKSYICDINGDVKENIIDCSDFGKICHQKRYNNTVSVGFCIENRTTSTINDKYCVSGDLYEDGEFIKGIITTYDNLTHIDRCNNNGDVIEYFCNSNNYLNKTIIQCDKDFYCDFGICIENQTIDLTNTTQNEDNEKIIPFCYDSDYGIEPRIFGYVEDNYGNYNKDKCRENIIIEYFCDSNNQTKYKERECSYECFDGKCQPQPKEEIITDDNGNTYFNDSNRVKLTYNENKKKLIYTDSEGERFEISTQNFSEKSIIKIENGIEKKEIIKPEELALVSHKIQKFSNKGEAENFIENIDQTLKKVEIKKQIDYNKNINKSKIKIELDKIENLKNYSIYLVIPKEIASNLDDINILNNGGGTPFIVDKDPVIGWYFDESENNNKSEIEYEVKGNKTDDIKFVITEQAVIYNGPNLIINYRETSCNENEVNLFELDNIVNSKVYAPFSNKFYKVCLSYKEDSIFFENTASKTTLFTFDENGNISFTDKNGNKIDIQYSDKLDFDYIISEKRPNENYSCLGSVLNKDNSLFGDCLYAEKKIWINMKEKPKINVISDNNQEEETINQEINDIDFEKEDTNKIKYIILFISVILLILVFLMI